MRIAITLRSFETDCAPPAEVLRSEAPSDYFAEFSVEETMVGAQETPKARAKDDTVQVTVVLRGRRQELEDPALGMTDLILGALRSRPTESDRRTSKVIDATGIAVESVY